MDVKGTTDVTLTGITQCFRKRENGSVNDNLKNLTLGDVKVKTQKLKLEVKEFNVTDTCDACGSPQGGYVNANLDRYVNLRDGHNCANCGVSEKPI